MKQGGKLHQLLQDDQGWQIQREQSQAVPHLHSKAMDMAVDAVEFLRPAGPKAGWAWFHLVWTFFPPITLTEHLGGKRDSGSPSAKTSVV